MYPTFFLVEGNHSSGSALATFTVVPAVSCPCGPGFLGACWVPLSLNVLQICKKEFANNLLEMCHSDSQAF